MPGFRIRKAGAEDAAKLALIGAASFLEAFADELNGSDIVEHVEEKLSPASFRRLIESEGAEAWLVEQPVTGAPFGSALVTRPDLPIPTREEDRELRRIYFLPRCHGTGAAAS